MVRHLTLAPVPNHPHMRKSVKIFIRNQYEPAKHCEELICTELIRMNKVTIDFPMGITDKDLSEELQLKSEQPWEVECKCLISHPSTWLVPARSRLEPSGLSQKLTQRPGRQRGQTAGT